MVSALRASIDFLEKFGFFDVILPFLLVFTIVFGILEKTKVFGVEEFEGRRVPKKNINAMVAFVIAFLAIAAKEVVLAIQVSMPQIALGLIVLVCFMMLAGSIMGDSEFSFEKRKGWVAFLTAVIFVCISLIFINAFGWLEPFWDWLQTAPPSFIGPTVLIVVVFGAIFFIVGGKPKKIEEGGE